MASSDQEWTKVEDMRQSRMGPSGLRGCERHQGEKSSDESMAETEVYVSDEGRWKKASEVFPDHPGARHSCDTRSSSHDPKHSGSRCSRCQRCSRCASEKREAGKRESQRGSQGGYRRTLPPSVCRMSCDVNDFEGIEGGDRRSVARKSLEGDVRQSVAMRKSDREEEGDLRRASAMTRSDDGGEVYSIHDEGARRSTVRMSSALGEGRRETAGGDGIRRSLAHRATFRDEHSNGDLRRSIASHKSHSGDESGELHRSDGSEGDARRSTVNRASYVSRDEEGDARRSTVNRASYTSRDEDGDARRSTVNRASYLSRDEDGDARRSTVNRASYASRDEDGDGPRSTVNRASYVSRDEGGDARRSTVNRASYVSRDEGGDVARGSVATRKSYSQVAEGDARRSTRSTINRASYVSRDEEGDIASRKSYDAGIEDEGARRSMADRKSYDLGRDSQGDGTRRSTVNRASYVSRDDEGAMRRSIASRKSYNAGFEDNEGVRRSTRSSAMDDFGDIRQSVATRKSYVDPEEEGDVRRSTVNRLSSASREAESGSLNRSSYGREEESALRRSELRRSYEEGDGLRSSVAYPRPSDAGVPRLSRQSEGGDLRSLGRRASQEGPRLSREERRSRLLGSEQRMLSQPPAPEDSESDLLVEDGFRRKSEVTGPKPRASILTLELDADNVEEMKSIVWKFTERGAVVKVINKNCPEAVPESLRAGDLLTFINEECVLEQPKAFIQQAWKEQQLEDRYVVLRFKPVEREAGKLWARRLDGPFYFQWPPSR
ncbi:Uncharacterized protein SCF082_LOCUS45294 [Durusdinium trenchii]|uniref:PDZ domain-containing protein n=1 Tax=Durusdinium trenchii TaxID=1381693 RepID=A0ABP0R8L4_9DINO